MASRLLIFTVVSSFLLASSYSAYATLGGDVASVRADQQQLKASLRTIAVGRYTLFEIQTASGTVVREYASASGTVFAVTWEGPSLPDLRQILGGYFSQVEASSNETAATGPRVIDRPDLIFYSGGRVRAFHGKAAVPGLIPQGVSLEDIH